MITHLAFRSLVACTLPGLLFSQEAAESSLSQSPGQPGTVTVAVPSSRIRLNIDTTNAEATLKLLEGTPTQQEIERFKSLPATADLIRRATGWNMKLTGDDLWAMIQKAKSGEKTDVFGYNAVLSEKDKIRGLIARASAEQGSVENYLSAQLAPYLPPGKTLDLNVIMILGGFSAGFTLGDKDTMYTGAHYYDGDFIGFRTMLLHEAFHNVQALSAPARDLSSCLTKGEAAAYNIMDRIFDEGSAEYVADVWKPEAASPYNAKTKTHLEVNANAWRYENIEKLINYTVVSAVDLEGKQPDAEVLNTILTDWNWNNPAYFYGYRNVKRLAQKHGQQRIADYLSAGPTAFFKDHLALQQASQEKSHFSPRFVEVLEAIDRKVANCPLTKTT